MSVNQHRRHLTESQRAMIAAKFSTLPVGNPDFGNKANLPDSHDSTLEAVAERMKVSSTTVKVAKRVLKNPAPVAPVVASLVHDGSISLNAAESMIGFGIPEDKPRSAPALRPPRSPATLSGRVVSPQCASCQTARCLSVPRFFASRLNRTARQDVVRLSGSCAAGGRYENDPDRNRLHAVVRRAGHCRDDRRAGTQQRAGRVASHCRTALADGADRGPCACEGVRTAC